MFKLLILFPPFMAGIFGEVVELIDQLDNIAISNRNQTRSWFLDVPYLPYTSSVGGAEQT
jgi:hypothetical protein